MKTELQDQINLCTAEISDIDTKMSSLSPLDKTKIYLTHYALIKACGTIEFVYWSIVADYFSSSPMHQIHTYLEKTVRNGSMSATYENMCKLLGNFDDAWKNNFKAAVNAHPDKERLLDSSKSLVNNRHTFAHGRTPTATFQDIKNYYNDAIVLLNIFDSVVV